MSRFLRIAALPVAHGDAIWIEYGDSARTRRVLIDGGPAHTYPALRNTFLALPEEQRHLDLLIVTHVDNDHIDGAIRLLLDEAVGATFRDVWLNGWAQLQQADDELGPKQGEFFAALLDRAKIQVNDDFGGRPIFVPAQGPLPEFRLPDDGPVFTLLSPELAQLERLAKEWDCVVRGEGYEPGDVDEALERLAKRREYAAPLSDELGDEPLGGDKAIANGSSIAMLLEYEGRSILLAADAFPSVLARSLGRLAEQRGREVIPVDLFKVSHHGSRGNVSEELLASVACRHFLVSTNGARFGHPDADAIDFLIQRTQEPELWFNHRCETTERWAREDPRYTSVFTNGGSREVG